MMNLWQSVMTRRSGSGILLNSSSRRFCTSGIFLVSGQNKSSSIKCRFYLLLYFYCVLLLSPLRSVLGILPPTGRKDSFNFLVKPWTVNKQLFSRKWQCLKNSLRADPNRFIDHLDRSNVRKIIVNCWLLIPWMFGSGASTTYLSIGVVDNL